MTAQRFSADRHRVGALLEALVDIPSVNPVLDGGPGEVAIATAVEAELTAMGLTPERQFVAPGGRDNILALLPGGAGSPKVLLEAHMDTVTPSGRAQAAAERDGDRIVGRGACDTKGSLVAMLEALRLLESTEPDERATVLFAAAIDEEVSGMGAEAIVARHGDIDMAIVGEPTGLELATAHKGVLRFTITAVGRPAHSSKPHLGVNAIHAMARVLDALESSYIPTLGEVSHPLVGSPTLNVSTIDGGTALNIVPASCEIGIDRRVNPGEDGAQILATIDGLLNRLLSEGTELIRSEPSLLTAALDTPTDHPVVTGLAAGRLAATGVESTPIGVTYGTDASFFGPAGIPSVIFGPGSIDQAHGDDEFVEIEEVAVAAEILAETTLALRGAT